MFSNAVLHWIPDAGAVIASVHRALKPGGRFVAEFGGAGCVQTVRLALIDAANRRGLDGAALDPWFFPTEAAYRALLEAHGFARARDDAVPAADAAAGRHHRLARDVRAAVSRRGAGRRSRRVHAGRPRRGAAGAVRSGARLDAPTTCACASPPSGRRDRDGRGAQPAAEARTRPRRSRPHPDPLHRRPAVGRRRREAGTGARRLLARGDGAVLPAVGRGRHPPQSR